MFLSKGKFSFLKQQLFSNSRFESIRNSSSFNTSSLLNTCRQLPNHSLHIQLSTQVLDIDDGDHLNYAYLGEVGQKALSEPDFFNVKRLINIREMFDSRVYMGHKEGTLNPYMKPYIFGSRLGHLVIDLDQSVHLLQEALNFAANIAFRNGIILFVNKSASTGHIVEKTAKSCGEYSHCREWRVGTFTDSINFFESVTRLPDLLIFLSTMNNVFEQHPAIAEAAKHMIPTIGVVDTNSDPCLVTYPVPGNDDSIQSVSYFCRVFEEAIKIAKQKRIECLQKPVSTQKV